ncbi:phage tail tape measure protein [Aquamicrobium sp. cd-1]|uniref:Phage tail tape measure protein n=2 Tax=Aquamicrobium zhengzhouense TaxID=2781738 RepID=A0ABS0SCL7_9HYPH|nr:phage tail tape measure protein [Aquamicrobium zhengzhouense]
MVEAAAVAYGLARAMASPLKAATEFETTLEDIGQKLDEPVAKLPKLGKEIRDVARQTTQSAAQIATGMDVLAGMGASRGDALGLLMPIGKAATAYNASIADLSQAGYAALDNLKVPANEFGKALDAMAQAGKAGAFELKDMAQYFPSLGAAYQGLGQTGVSSVADLAAALQVVRKGTGDSAEAATNLSNILQKVYAPQTIKAFKKIGIDLRKEMDRAAKAGMTPIEAIAEITRKALKGDLSRLGDLFTDAQVQKGLRPLIQNLDLYRQIRAEAMSAQGVVEEDYQRRLVTGQLATQRIQIAMENLNLAIGSALLPALANLGDVIVPIITKMAEWAEANPALTQAIVALSAGLVGLRVAAIAAQFSLLWMKGGLLAAGLAGMKGLAAALRIAGLAFMPFGAGARAARSAMIGFTAAASVGGTGSALKIMGSSLLGLLSPMRLVTSALKVLRLAVIGTGIGAALVGIAAAGTWIYNNWQGIGVAFEAFKGAFMRAIEPVMPALEPVIDGVSSLFDWIGDLLGPIDEMNGSWAAWGIAAGNAVGEIVAAVVGLPGKIIAFSEDMLDAGRELAQAMWDGVKEMIAQMVDWFRELPGRIIEAIGSIDLTSIISWPSPPSWWTNRPSWLGGGGGESAGIAGARAAGGPIAAGRTYLVGEEGPELITPSRSGYVHSADETAAMAHGGSRNTGSGSAGSSVLSLGSLIGELHVHPAPGMDEEALAQKAARLIGQAVREALSGIQSDSEWAIA